MVHVERFLIRKYTLMSLILLKIARGRLVLSPWLVILFFSFSLPIAPLICFGAIQSRLAGSILTSIESGYSMSHQRTVEKGINFWALIILLFVLLCELIFIHNFTGKDEISQIVNNLHVSGGDTIISKALKYYEVYISIISPCCLIGIQYNDFDVSSF